MTSVAVSPSRLIRTWSPCDLDHRGEGDLRQAEALGEHRRDDAHAAVGRGHAAQTIDGRRRRSSRSPSASTSEVASASEPAIASSTTWTPLSAPICSALRTASAASSGPTRQRGHLDRLVGLVLLLELQRLLDGVLVELGEQAVDANAVHGVVRLEVPVGGGVGHVLHTDDNVHGWYGPRRAPPVSRRVTERGYRRVNRGRNTGAGCESVTAPGGPGAQALARSRAGARSDTGRRPGRRSPRSPS